MGVEAVSERLTSKQYQDAMGKPRANKYGAKKVKIDGHTFDSKREAQRYGVLKQMQAAGVISDLELQPVFPLIIDDKPVLIRSPHFKNGRAAKYTADFRYRQDGKVIVEDAKSPATRHTSALRIAVAEAIYNMRVILV